MHNVDSGWHSTCSRYHPPSITVFHTVFTATLSHITHRLSRIMPHISRIMFTASQSPISYRSMRCFPKRLFLPQYTYVPRRHRLSAHAPDAKMRTPDIVDSPARLLVSCLAENVDGAEYQEPVGVQRVAVAAMAISPSCEDPLEC